MKVEDNNPLQRALESLGVRITIASDDFRKWIAERFPFWNHTDEFCNCIPHDWTEVCCEGYELCSLNDETSIREASEKLDSSSSLRLANLLPIGALLDGSLLMLKMESSSEMIVGRFSGDHLLSVPENQLDSIYFHPFPISYVDWLCHIQQHPEDSRFL